MLLVNEFEGKLTRDIVSSSWKNTSWECRNYGGHGEGLGGLRVDGGQVYLA
jgi:hypothetical protein